MSADPVPYVAAAWLLSLAVLGALTTHAIIAARR